MVPRDGNALAHEISLGDAVVVPSAESATSWDSTVNERLAKALDAPAASDVKTVSADPEVMQSVAKQIKDAVACARRYLAENMTDDDVLMGSIKIEIDEPGDADISILADPAHGGYGVIDLTSPPRSRASVKLGDGSVVRITIGH